MTIDAKMTIDTYLASLSHDHPPEGLTPALIALWWDAKGNWALAHSLIDALETPDAMAVHAYLHRKEGEDWNADYWYRRAGRAYHRPALEDEWHALARGLIDKSPQSK